MSAARRQHQGTIPEEHLAARDRLSSWLTSAGVSHFASFHPDGILVIAVWPGDAAIAERAAAACIGETMLRWHVRTM